MKHIDNINSLKFLSHFLIKKTSQDYTLYYIGTIKNIIDTTEIETKLSYYYIIPNKENLRCFFYNNEKNIINIDSSSKIFELSDNEFIELYISFLDNDKKKKDNIDNSFLNTFN